jgi:hypothetical protein
MKKNGLLMVAMVFVFGMGTAYASDWNGVTDFTGRSYDMFEIQAGDGPAKTVYESSAPGSKRVIEDLNNTGKSYDLFEIELVDSGKRSMEGAAPGSLRQMKRNWAAKEPSGKSYDTFEIEVPR